MYRTLVITGANTQTSNYVVARCPAVFIRSACQ